MSLAADIYAVLAADAALANLVGTRIYPDIAPQEVAKPFVVWQEISDVPQNGLNGNCGLDDYRVQVTCWDRTGLGVRNARDAVILAMANNATLFKSLLIDVRALPFEPDTKLYGAQADFSVWRSS